MIKPTIGRVVWFHPAFKPDAGMNEVCHAAIVAHVWNDEMVNLAIFDSNGNAYSRTSVRLFQGEGVRPACDYAEWMPYQIGQAKASITTDKLHPHQQRVVDEKDELDAKLEKLSAFISGSIYLGLEAKAQDLLRQQALAMTSYSIILQQRISLF